jgi:UDP-N-acetylglucosamine 1-carboxyvinyltransferase
MTYIKITGKQKLEGEVKIAGAKNAALPIMMASILADEKVILTNIPNLTDIDSTILLLQDLGYIINRGQEDIEAGTQIIEILPAKEITHEISKLVSSSMRASIWALGPMLAKHGKAIIPLPGGDKIGERNIDMHVKALQNMGAIINIENDKIIAKADKRLRAIKYNFHQISVGATANILMASCLADGKTILSNCAIEPEIVDLANFLNSIGAKIYGIGTHELTIEGVLSLKGVKYNIISDRIEAGTYAIMAAISSGNILIRNISTNIIENIIDCLSKIGINIIKTENTIYVQSSGNFKPLNISTAPYPGFPTDLQAQISTLLALAKGESKIEENIFENRFMHIIELQKMGADIKLLNNHAWNIKGVDELYGTDLFASDIRASASLIVAAIGANGISTIHNLHHLDRGYANLESKLLNLNANIKRIWV